VTAVIHPSVIVPDTSKIWDFAIVEAGVTIGPQCAIGSHVFLGAYTTLGQAVRIQHGAFITRRTQIGDRVFIGPNVTFTDDKRPMVNNPRYRPQPPIVEDDVSIGGHAVILPGVRLGRGCTIGAGAVVTKVVPPYTTVVGNPAHPLVRKESPCAASS
jgi:UDP-2-acetamido-3-amino-2,3-dideoxy-glucuronate N-acetyltransferase